MSKKFKILFLNILIVALFSALMLTFGACGAHKHTVEIVPGYAKTCTENGLTDGERCSDCGEILKEQEVIYAGHTPDVIAGYAKTCSENGLTDGERCSDCGETLKAQEVIPASHNFGEFMEEIAPTCSTVGRKAHKTCLDCEKHFDNAGVEIENLDIAIVPNAHVYSEFVEEIAPTCSTVGKKAHKTCLDCEKHFDNTGAEIENLDIAIVPNAHEFGNLIAEISKTCTENGTKEHKTCNLCQKNFDKDSNEIFDLVIPSGHETEIVVGYAKTCTENGLTDGLKCSICQEVLEEQQIILAGHTPEVVKGYAKTCTENGLTDGSRCAICLETLTEGQVIPAGHEEVELKGYAKTCTEDGLTDGSMCSVCQEILIEQEVLKAVGQHAENLKAGDFCSVCNSTIEGTKGLRLTMQSNGEYAVTGFVDYDINRKIVYLPKTYNGVAVTAIGDGAFRGAGTVTEFIIPEGYKTIGASAFLNCASLTTLEMPSTVTEVGSKIFEKCPNLTNLYLSDNIEDMKEFGYNSISTTTPKIALTTLNNISYIGTKTNKYFYLVKVNNTTSSTYTINSNTKIIGDYTFYRCTNVTSLTIPYGVKIISSFAFGNYSSAATKLKTISLPSTLERINNQAFYGCKALTSVTLPANIKVVENNAFYSCSGLTNITIGSNLIDLAGLSTVASNITTTNDAIYFGDGTNSYLALAKVKNTSLTSFEVNANTKYILQGAFSGLTAIERVNLPEGLEIIEKSAFSGCSSLSTINLPSTLKTIKDSAFSGCSALTSISIPDDIELIDGAFSGSGIKELRVESLEQLFKCRLGNTGVDVYVNDVLLEDLVIPGSIKVIESEALYGIKSLKTVEVQDGVRYIGARAFAYCTNLQSVIIPSSVEEMGAFLFNNCKNLTELTLPYMNTRKDETGEGFIEYFFNKSYRNSGYFDPSVIRLSKLTITGGTIIEPYAFALVSTLTEISLPNTIKEIGEGAIGAGYLSQDKLTKFGNCWYIGNVSNPYLVLCSVDDGIYTNPNHEFTIHENTKFILEKAFYNTKIKNIVVPEGVISIGNYAFKDCAYLETISLPTTLINFGDYVFENCTKLTPTIIENDVEYIGSTLNPYLVTYSIVEDKIANTSIAINGKTKFINSQAFKNMGKYASLVVPEGVLQIRAEAFYGAYSSKLTSISLPTTLKYIGARAFGYHKNLKKVTLPKNLEYLGYASFMDTGLTTINIPSKVVWLNKISGQTLTSVTFENPNGWQVTIDDFEAVGSNGNVSGDLTNASVAATLLKDAMSSSKIWRRLKTPTNC